MKYAPSGCRSLSYKKDQLFLVVPLWRHYGQDALGGYLLGWKLRPPESFKIVMPSGHVPHFIRAVGRSFRIYYFLIDVLMVFFLSFCSHAKCRMNEVVQPLHSIRISQSVSFRYQRQRYTGTALLLQATVDYASDPGVRGTFFRTIPQYIKIIIYLGSHCQLGLFAPPQGLQVRSQVRLFNFV